MRLNWLSIIVKTANKIDTVLCTVVVAKHHFIVGVTRNVLELVTGLLSIPSLYRTYMLLAKDAEGGSNLEYQINYIYGLFSINFSRHTWGGPYNFKKLRDVSQRTKWVPTTKPATPYLSLWEFKVRAASNLRL